LFKNKKDPSPLDFGVIFSSNKEQGKFLKVSGVLNSDKNLLKVGDEVLEIDNVKVLNPTQLNNESRGKLNVTLKILRDKKEQEVKLQLKPRGSVTDRVGLIFSNVVVSDRALISRLPINQIMSNPKSSLVVQNLKSGPASGKLRKYDVLNYIDGKEFKTVQSLYDYLKDKKEIEVVFRRPSVDEERKLIFNDYHDKIEVKNVKILKFE
jgi:S1-C subfamily serine protease